MKIAIPQIGEPVLHTYKYDQLNRIKEVNNYNSYNAGTNTWSATNAHKELLSFDANGNIQTALLNGSSASLPHENFAYTYDGVKKNRLLSIHNSVGNVTSEYEYDAIGNVTKDELEGNENMEWNVYGKLKSLTKIGSGTAISFGYDASGNRISKKVGTAKQQWYVRDASGNIMATYIKESAINSGDLSTEMFNMYGSSMLGGWKFSVNMETMPPLANTGELERGNQEFYFSNHLGNNLVILSDRKEGIQDTGNPTQVTDYEPYVLSATDYSAYGENLIGREYNPDKIKFGFNGKWNDFETGYQDYGMRMSSSKRRGFVSVDPLKKSYPYYSPYQFAGNNPIEFIDLDGLEPSNNPETPGANEERAIMEIQAINLSTKTTNLAQNMFSPGINDDLKGRISCSPSSEFVTDTKGDPENNFNMKVSTGVTMNVDESQAKRFNNYEAFVIKEMMNNFVTGEGPENYNFPTNGVMSSKFIGSDVLFDALSNYRRGIIKDGEPYQAEFKGRELARDIFKTNSLFSSITGFVGSAQITIQKTDAGMIQITIFNITSLTSGDISKDFLGGGKSKAYWPKSYVRHPEVNTGYGNISQTFNLLLPAKILGL